MYPSVLCSETNRHGTAHALAFPSAQGFICTLRGVLASDMLDHAGYAFVGAEVHTDRVECAILVFCCPFCFLVVRVVKRREAVSAHHGGWCDADDRRVNQQANALIREATDTASSSETFSTRSRRSLHRSRGIA